MLGLFFIPLIVDFKIKSRTLEVEKQAYQLLYEELNTFIINPPSTSNHAVVINGIEYQIFLNKIPNSEQKEVCVKLEQNLFHIDESICQISE
jgi:hypothetical protein